MTRRIVASFVVLLIALVLSSIFATPAYAACTIVPGNIPASDTKNSVTATFTGSDVLVNGKHFPITAGQCKGPGRKPNGTYTLSCDYPSEANARDSIVAALCGASVELGKTNSTCWICGADMKCSGAAFAAGDSDAALFQNKLEIPGNNINDTWRVANPPPSFTYNGHPYTWGGGVVVCNSNVVGCGIDESSGIGCKNGIFEDVTSGMVSADALMCNAIDATGGLDPSFSSTNTAPVQSDNGSCNVSNMARYIMPCTGDQQCEPINGSAFDSGHAWVGAVNNQVVGYDKGLGGGYSVQKSNGQHLLFYQGPDGVIRLVEDTTWTQSETCADSGKPALQRIYQKNANGQETLGGAFAKSSMKCGDIISNTAYNKAYEYGATDTPLDPNARQCSNTAKNHAGDLNSTNKLIFAGSVECMGQPKDAIAIQVTSGGGAGEVFFFCKDQGLCAWYQNIDTVGSDPSTWGGQDICRGTINDVDLSNMVCQAEPQTAADTKLPWVVTFVESLDILPQVVKDFLGRTLFNQQQVLTPDISNEALQLDGANAKLLPKKVKGEIKPITHEFKYSANTVVCHPSSNNENKFNVAKAGIIHFNAPLLHVLTGGAPVFDAITGLGSLGKGEFNQNAHYPPVSVNVDNILPCGTVDSGDSLRKTVTAGSGEQQYVVDKPKAPEYKTNLWFSAQDIQNFFNCVTHEDNPLSCISLMTKDTGARLQYNYNAPYAQGTMGHLSRDTSGKATGALNIFRPHQISLNKRIAEEPNTVEQTLVPQASTLAMNAELEGLAGIQEYADMTNCALTPKNKQGDRSLTCGRATFTGETNTTAPPAVPETSNWAKPEAEQNACMTDATTKEFPRDTSTPLDQAMAAATQGRIPLCVLKGVADIEGAKAEIAKASCSPNACSAMGPFQLTVGYTNTKTGNACGKDTSCSACGLSSCPNALNYVPAGTNPCDTKSAAVGAVSLLIGKAKYFGYTLTASDPKTQKKGIIAAGDSYYGTPKPLTYPKFRTADGGYFSYGEYVYHTCDPTYTKHIDHGFR